MPDNESKYSKLLHLKDYTSIYSSKSKTNPSKDKKWVGKELQGEEEGPFGFCEDDEKSPVAEIFSQSLAVSVFGKDRAAKTKFSTTSRMVVSRMPEGESSDLSTIVEKAVIEGNTPTLPSESLAKAMAFKIIMEDDDANLANFIMAKQKDHKGSYALPIDGDCSFTKQSTWDYDEFKDSVSSPKKLVKDLTAIEYVTAFEDSPEKQEKALNIISNGITSEQLIEAFDNITTRIKKDNFQIFKDVIGETNGNKGMLPDIKQGYDNGVYSLDEMNFANEKLFEYQNELKNSVNRFAGFVQHYKEELKSKSDEKEPAEKTATHRKRSYKEMTQESREDKGWQR